MSHRTHILLVIIAGAAFGPALAAPANHLITADQVAAAASKMGLQVSPQQVTMLSEVAATTSAPSLAVRSVQRRDDHQLLVRMECESPSLCLPFYVSLRVENSTEVLQARAQSQDSASSNPSSPPIVRQLAIRTGSTATLQLDSDRVHIRIPVVCLENGAVGQTVRVRSRDHRLVYTAQVIDSTLLKGRL